MFQDVPSFLSSTITTECKQERKPERGRAQRGKKKGNVRTREDSLISHPFYSTPLPVIFLRAFPHAQSTITYRTVERSNLLLSNYLSRGLLSISFITSLSSSTVLSLSFSHTYTRTRSTQVHIRSVSLSLFLSHTLLATTLFRSAGAFCCRLDDCYWACSSGRSAWLARADAAAAVDVAALPCSPLPKLPSRLPE